MNKTMMVSVIITLISMTSVLATILIDQEAYDNTSNAFLNAQNSKLSWLLPAVMLVICITMAMIDFGTIGVTIGSMLSLVILYWIGVVYITPITLISFVVMSIILVFKLV